MRNNDFILYENDLELQKIQSIWGLAYQKFRNRQKIVHAFNVYNQRQRDVIWLCCNKINTSKLCFSGFS